VRQVRERLDEAGVNWAKINLSGGRVVVRPSRSSDARPPMAMTPLALDGSAHPQQRAGGGRDAAQSAAALAAQPTLRGAIAGYLAGCLKIDPARLRIAFDANDAVLLETDIATTRFELQPLSSFASDQVALAIRTWDAGRAQHNRSITVRLLALTPVATLRRDVGKGEQIGEADLERAEQWMPVGQSAGAAEAALAVGRIAARNLKAGEQLRERDVRRETLVKRGDLVMVRCLVGNVAISLQAEARGDGGEGDLIEFRKQGERETFLASVTAPGEAVVDAGAVMRQQ
jgi:flagella basal body P-ring formation protein FlgA